MKSKNSPKSETDVATNIRAAYMDYVLTEGRNPTSVYHFAKSNGFSETEFYQFYNNFDAVSIALWETILNKVWASLESSEEYARFSVRERILSFYFTLMEVMKGERSYVSYSAASWGRPGKKDVVQDWVAAKMTVYFDQMVNEGFETGELKNRSLVSKHYAKSMLIQFWLILGFWIKDSSRDFEDTDAFIEKTINLGFGLMADNTIDKALDLAKFVWGRSSILK